MDINKLILKKQNSGTAITILKNKAGGLALPYFKTYCKATIIKAVCYWQKNRTAKTIFSTNDAKTTGYPHASGKNKEKKIHLDIQLTPLTKFNSRWMTDLNVKGKTIKTPRRGTWEWKCLFRCNNKGMIHERNNG